MKLSDEQLDGLRRILKDCTARITPMDGVLPAGSAFYVSDSLLVTNRHVVGDRPADGTHRVRVHDHRAADPVVGTVRPPSASVPDLDIALIDVEANPRRSAVVLHRAVLDGEFILAGFPQEDFYTSAEPGAEAIDAGGHARDDNRTGQVQLVRLADAQIKPGLSGGPVLSARSGAVVAVTVYTEDQQAALGGGSLPIAGLLEAYPDLRTLAAEPPAIATRRWRDLLDRALWESLGFVWDAEEQLDIYLTGNRSRWKIDLRPGGLSPQQRRVRDLGDDMGEVLVRWARSSGRRDESEVRLLGRLLSAAIFPKEVAKRLPPPSGLDRDPVLIRLHMDPDGPLADLPWEFATDPASPDRFLAATEGYSFVRVGGTGALRARRLEPRPTGQPVTVLGIVVQPDETVRWPSVIDTRLPKAWPGSDDIAKQLEAAVSAPKTAEGASVFQYEAIVNPTLSQLVNRAQQGPPVDIVHYIGFAYREAAGPVGTGTDLDRTMMACSATRRDDGSNEGSGSDDVRHHRASEFVKAVAALQPACVVLEFGTPPLDERLGRGCEPVGPSILAAAETLGVDTLICGRPVHPMQYERFNIGLYARLAAGEMVEKAVQLARQDLLMDQPVDFAGFGWFMVTTGSTPRPRFFAGPPTVRTSGRDGVPTPPQPTRSMADGFHAAT